MEITEVRIKLMDDPGDRLQAFCSITFDDCFVVRDLKVIEGTNGHFVAMPSRKLTAHCSGCGCKNHLRAAHCNQCGLRLKVDRANKDEDGRAKLYADIAHPINSVCREMIQTRVIEEFRTEINRSQQPGYISRYEDLDDVEAAVEEVSSVQKAASEKPSEAKSFEKTQVQPAEAVPPAPHQTPSKESSDAPKRNTDFGAGIF